MSGLTTSVMLQMAQPPGQSKSAPQLRSVFSASSKTLLNNVIRHTDTHNRMLEEEEMWRVMRLGKTVEKKEDPPRPNFLYDDRRQLHSGLNWAARQERQTYMDEETSRVSSCRSTFWMRQLEKAEDKDPYRWGHGGFKEMYPQDFDSDRSEKERQIREERRRFHAKRNERKRAEDRRRRRRSRGRYASVSDSDQSSTSPRRHRSRRSTSSRSASLGRNKFHKSRTSRSKDKRKMKKHKRTSKDRSVAGNSEHRHSRKRKKKSKSKRRKRSKHSESVEKKDSRRKWKNDESCSSDSDSYSEGEDGEKRTEESAIKKHRDDPEYDKSKDQQPTSEDIKLKGKTDLNDDSGKMGRKSNHMDDSNVMHKQTRKKKESKQSVVDESWKKFCDAHDSEEDGIHESRGLEKTDANLSTDINSENNMWKTTNFREVCDSAVQTEPYGVVEDEEDTDSRKARTEKKKEDEKSNEKMVEKSENFDRQRTVVGSTEERENKQKSNDSSIDLFQETNANNLNTRECDVASVSSNSTTNKNQSENSKLISRQHRVIEQVTGQKIQIVSAKESFSSTYNEGGNTNTSGEKQLENIQNSQQAAVEARSDISRLQQDKWTEPGATSKSDDYNAESPRKKSSKVKGKGVEEHSALKQTEKERKKNSKHSCDPDSEGANNPNSEGGFEYQKPKNNIECDIGEKQVQEQSGKVVMSEYRDKNESVYPKQTGEIKSRVASEFMSKSETGENKSKNKRRKNKEHAETISPIKGGRSKDASNLETDFVQSHSKTREPNEEWNKKNCEKENINNSSTYYVDTEMKVPEIYEGNLKRSGKATELPMTDSKMVKHYKTVKDSGVSDTDKNPCNSLKHSKKNRDKSPDSDNEHRNNSMERENNENLMSQRSKKDKSLSDSDHRQSDAEKKNKVVSHRKREKDASSSDSDSGADHRHTRTTKNDKVMSHGKHDKGSSSSDSDHKHSHKIKDLKLDKNPRNRQGKNVSDSDHGHSKKTKSIRSRHLRNEKTESSSYSDQSYTRTKRDRSKKYTSESDSDSDTEHEKSSVKRKHKKEKRGRSRSSSDSDQSYKHTKRDHGTTRHRKDRRDTSSSDSNSDDYSERKSKNNYRSHSRYKKRTGRSSRRKRHRSSSSESDSYSDDKTNGRRHGYDRKYREKREYSYSNSDSEGSRYRHKYERRRRKKTAESRSSSDSESSCKRKKQRFSSSDSHDGRKRDETKNKSFRKRKYSYSSDSNGAYNRSHDKHNEKSRQKDNDIHSSISEKRTKKHKKKKDRDGKLESRSENKHEKLTAKLKPIEDGETFESHNMTVKSEPENDNQYGGQILQSPVQQDHQINETEKSPEVNTPNVRVKTEPADDYQYSTDILPSKKMHKSHKHKRKKKSDHERQESR